MDANEHEWNKKKRPRNNLRNAAIRADNCDSILSRSIDTIFTINFMRDHNEWVSTIGIDGDTFERTETFYRWSQSHTDTHKKCGWMGENVYADDIVVNEMIQ